MRDRQTGRHTDTQMAMAMVTIHFTSAMPHAKCNYYHSLFNQILHKNMFCMISCQIMVTYKNCSSFLANMLIMPKARDVQHSSAVQTPVPVDRLYQTRLCQYSTVLVLTAKQQPNTLQHFYRCLYQVPFYCRETVQVTLVRRTLASSP